MFIFLKFSFVLAMIFVAFMVYCGYRHNLKYMVLGLWDAFLDVAAHVCNSVTWIFRRPRHRVTRDGRIVKMKDSRGRKVTLDESEKFYHG